MRTVFSAILCVCCLANYSFAGNAAGADSETWNWMPTWRAQADCGPNALYVLMNLEGCKVTLGEVKNLVSLDPVQGCSIQDLIDAAAALGFTLDARFVEPGDVYKLPRPFILHGITSQEKNLGHFIVVADFDSKKRNFALVDPIRETFGWNPESSLLNGYSGYVLVPKYPVAWHWNFFAGMSLILCAFGCLFLVYHIATTHTGALAQ